MKRYRLRSVFALLLSVCLLFAFGMHEPALSAFQQVNEDGFGNPQTTGGLERQTMVVFQGKLYVGAAVPSGLYENCVNDLGLHDMGGNIYEWASRNEKEVFMADQSYLLTSMDTYLMNEESIDHRHEFLGHRCCKIADTSESQNF